MSSPHGLRQCLAATAICTLAGLSAGCGSSSTVRTGGVQPVSRPAPSSPDRAAMESVARANRLKAQGLTKQALAEFERAIETNPMMTTAYIGAGDIYLENGDNESAAVRYGQAAEITPGSFDANFKHGLALHLLERFAEAVEAYLKSLAIRPGDFKANLNVALAYLQFGESEKALPFAERAVKIEPKDAQARTNLGAVFDSLGRYDDAVNQYLQANELMENPSPELLMNLAKALGATGRYEEMVNTLEEVIKERPSAVAYERLGAAKFRLERFDESEAAFREALELDSRHYPAINGVAVCLLNKFLKNDDTAARDEAVSLLRQSLQIERSQPRVQELVRKYSR